MMNETSIERMNLYEIVEFCTKNGFRQTAAYFAGLRNDPVVIDGHWIDKGFVARHIGYGSELWNRLERECIIVELYEK